MGLTLIAAAIALVVGHALPDLGRLRRFDWVPVWTRLVDRLGGLAPWLSVAVILLPPLALLGLLQWGLAGKAFGLASLALAIVVLFYAWGPRDLDLDVEAVATAPDADRRAAALVSLGLPPTGPINPTQAVDAVFSEGLHRWFAVLFWFAVLGPVGALAYRLTALLARHEGIADTSGSPRREAFKTLARVLEWPAAHLVTLGLAVAADFDAVARAWRDFHAERGEWFTLDAGFLHAAARASVDADIELDPALVDARAGIAELKEALSLNWRVLVVWGIVFALFVLAGLIG
jgi:AmpE protein